jgi:hypothetical protein
MNRSIVMTTLILLALAGSGGGCTTRVNVGNSLLWFAEHETGDFTEWTADNKGGYSADPPDTSVVISTDFAHSGTHSVRLANAAPSVYETARLWRQDSFPEEAYYSAWYYLPQTYRTTGDWTIMQFNTPAGEDGGSDGLLLDVDLRSLPGGDMILDIYDHRPPYLRSPTAEPAQPVPIERWFQIEVFYRNVGDKTGEFELFLDGRVNYDIHRPFGLSSATSWSPCSSTVGLSPAESTLYVDDAAISRVKVGPAGTL